MNSTHIDIDNHKFAVKCDHCMFFFPFGRDNLYYPNANQGIAGICKKCYDDISLNLIIKVDLSKLKIIKKKAEKLYLQRKQIKIIN